MSNPVEQLQELFKSFPGIGKRQAERFVYFLLREDKKLRAELAETITSLERAVSMCDTCSRFFVRKKNETICDFCSDTSRDKTLLLVVAYDSDLENIEHSGSYKGHYFVLGGTVPILEKQPEQKVRIKRLRELVKKQKPKEIIFAFSTNPEGENTRVYVTRELKQVTKDGGAALSTLGRGLSTGAELEYSDPETIKSALANRS